MRKSFSSENSWNFDFISLKLTFFKVTKSKNCGTAVKTEFCVSWGTIWGEFNFMRKESFEFDLWGQNLPLFEPITYGRDIETEVWLATGTFSRKKFRCQKSMNGDVSSRFDKKDPETRQKTFDINKFLKTALYMSWGTLWRTCLKNKIIFQNFTRTVQGSFWGESRFSNGKFLNLSLHFFETNTIRVQKLKNRRQCCQNWFPQVLKHILKSFFWKKNKNSKTLLGLARGISEEKAFFRTENFYSLTSFYWR